MAFELRSHKGSGSLTRLQSPPGLAGRGCGPAHPYDSGPCCCPEISVPCPDGPRMGPLTTWKLAFLTGRALRRRDGSQSSCNLISEVTSHHYAMFSLLEAGHRVQRGHKGRKPGPEQKQDPLGAVLGAACPSASFVDLLLPSPCQASAAQTHTLRRIRLCALNGVLHGKQSPT